MRSEPHPLVPLPPNKMVLPQGVLPPPPPRSAPANPETAPPAARLPIGACFNCEQTGRFARDCPQGCTEDKCIRGVEHQNTIILQWHSMGCSTSPLHFRPSAVSKLVTHEILHALRCNVDYKATILTKADPGAILRDVLYDVLCHKLYDAR